MKRFVCKIVCVLVIFLVNGVFTGEVSATSGKLKSASICQDSNGVYYGNHGDGHWHVASSRDTGWYPQGSSLGNNNPCVAASAPVKVEPTNTAPVLNFGVENYEIYDTEFKDSNINNEEIIKIYGVSASDKEDGDLTNNVNVVFEIGGAVGDYIILFNVSDSKGVSVSSEVVYKIIENDLPVIEIEEVIEINESDLSDIDLEYLMSEYDLNLIDQNSEKELDVEIDFDEGNSILIIKVTDAYGGYSEKEVQVHIIENSEVVSTITEDNEESEEGGLLIYLLIIEFIIFLGVNKFQLNSMSRFTKTYLVYVFLGLIGGHRFYNKKVKSGIAMFLTVGGFLIWYLVDGVLILTSNFKGPDGEIINTDISKMNIVYLSICFVINATYTFL